MIITSFIWSEGQLLISGKKRQPGPQVYPCKHLLLEEFYIVTLNRWSNFCTNTSSLVLLPWAYSTPALMLSTVHRWQWSFSIAKVPNATLASKPCSPGSWERISAEFQGSVSDFITPPPQCWSPRAVFTQGRNLTPYRSYIVFMLKSKCPFAMEKVFFPCGLNQVSFPLLPLK